MTTEELHEELRKCGFCKIGTGGGCDALVTHRYPEFTDENWNTEIMLTALEDASVPEVGDRIHVSIRHISNERSEIWHIDGDPADNSTPTVHFVLDTPEQVLAFARSVSCEAA